MAQTLAIFLLVLLFQSYPAASYAAYLVRLKNGKEFVASRYWEEGKRVMFDTGGGIFGLEKDSISKIEKTDRSSIGEEPVQKPNAQEPTPVKSEDQKEKVSTPPEIAKKDEEVVKEFRLLQERFSRLNDLTDNEVHKLSDDLNAFGRKLLGSHLAETYKDEYDAANTLIRAIDGLLKARAQ